MKLIKEILQAALDDQEDNYDYIILITGNVGLGKSNLELYCYLELWKHFNPTDKVNLRIFAVNISEWVNLWHKLKFAQFLFLDEAGDKLTTDDYNLKFNKKLRGTFSVVRKKRTIMVITMPYFMKFDSDLRSERVDVVIEVVARGKVKIYPKPLIDKANELYRAGNKAKNLSQLVFTPYRDDFPLFEKEHPDIWEEYCKKIEGKVDMSLLELVDSADDTKVSEVKACKIVSRSKVTLRQFLDKGYLPNTEKLLMPDGVTVRYKYDLDDLRMLIEKININLTTKVDYIDIADMPMHTVIGKKGV